MAINTELYADYLHNKIAIYGLGTETEKELPCLRGLFDVVGLLDGYLTEGEMYGLPIMTLERARQEKVRLIVVVARPGSCKAIRKKIGAFCEKYGIALMDVRGKDLLCAENGKFVFANISGESSEQLMNMAEEAEIVGFGLYDVLVMQKVLESSDLQELALSVEKKLEWDLRLACTIPRRKVVSIFDKLINLGKKIYIVDDSSLGKEQVQQILSACGIFGYKKIFCLGDCEGESQEELFNRYKESVKAASYLYVGVDGSPSLEIARSLGMEVVGLYSANQLFETLDYMGLDMYVKTIADRVKLGFFVSEIFNDPFCFENGKKVCVDNSYTLGELFFAPMITDFVLWMDDLLKQNDIEDVCFCARDGYLIRRMYRCLDRKVNSVYFLTSRIAAIRAGVRTEEDIRYVERMKYFGSEEDSLRVRFGIEPLELSKAQGVLGYQEVILDRAQEQSRNLKKYIQELDFSAGDIAMFDFVAKGTTQMYLQRLVPNHMKGFYFLQLEPDFMSDKGLDIEPFYTEDEKNQSAIFDRYYILETILTAPHPSVLGFDREGKPIYARETRSERDIQCFGRAQDGILNYFKEYISLVPESLRVENKKLDEFFLSLIDKIEITDSDFLALIVEDPFFNRMTDIKDVLE